MEKSVRRTNLGGHDKLFYQYVRLNESWALA